MFGTIRTTFIRGLLPSDVDGSCSLVLPDNRLGYQLLGRNRELAMTDWLGDA
jgi:hypothetical protein